MNQKKQLGKVLKDLLKTPTAQEIIRPAATSIRYDPIFIMPDPLDSLCGVFDESQPVEQYDGTLGVSRQFVDEHQSKIGQIQWNNDLHLKYNNPGNVSNVRWGSGIMISNDLFLTAGHCFDSKANGWRIPKSNGTNNPIFPQEIAKNMHINFNYQLDPNNNLRDEVSFKIMELLEYRQGGLDYAIVRIEGNPGQRFGIAKISDSDPPERDIIAIIGHPEGRPKTIEAGPITDYSDTRIGYNDIDTFGGSSGSGLLQYSTGKIVGVHTNGGCDFIGYNYGHRISSLIQTSQAIANLV